MKILNFTFYGANVFLKCGSVFQKQFEEVLIHDR